MKTRLPHMRNPLRSEGFNRFEATKDRSPRFRAFVILLLLLVSSFLVYVIAFKKPKTELTKSVIPSQPYNATSSK